MGTVALGWVVILAIVLLLGWLLTHSWEPTVDPWDDDVERWFAAQRTPGLSRLAAACTFLGNYRVGLVVAAAVAAGVSLWQRSLRPALFLTVLLTGAFGLYVAGTRVISRDRPPVPILDPGLVPDHSFPSGHVTAAVVVYGGAALLIARTSPRIRRWLSPLLLVPLAVAVARMYQGAHHPTDVFISLVFSAAWVAVVVEALLAHPSRTTDEAGASEQARVSSNLVSGHRRGAARE